MKQQKADVQLEIYKSKAEELEEVKVKVKEMEEMNFKLESDLQQFKVNE